MNQTTPPNPPLAASPLVSATPTDADFSCAEEIARHISSGNTRKAAFIVAHDRATIAQQAARIAELEEEVKLTNLLRASEKQAKVERGDMLCEAEEKIVTLQQFKARLEWLHTGGGKDAAGYEWGVFRVKWSPQGQPVEVWQTLSDFSDLDAEMAREAGFVPPPLSELTCFKCPDRSTCRFVDDAYNTNGECLAEK